MSWPEFSDPFSWITAVDCTLFGHRYLDSQMQNSIILVEKQIIWHRLLVIMLLGPWLISIWAHIKLIEVLLEITLSWVCMIHMLVSCIWCWWMHLVPRVSLELPVFLGWGHPRSQSTFDGSRSRLRCSSCYFWKCWKWEVVVWNQNPNITVAYQFKDVFR